MDKLKTYQEIRLEKVMKEFEELLNSMSSEEMDNFLIKFYEDMYIRTLMQCN